MILGTVGVEVASHVLTVYGVLLDSLGKLARLGLLAVMVQHDGSHRLGLHVSLCHVLRY